MPKRSKNLIFVIEESSYHVSSNLVRLYMNRCIIEEDGQFEILGVIQFTDKYSPTTVDLRMYPEAKRRKINNGSDLASDLWKLLAELPTGLTFAGYNETHLIAGVLTSRIHRDIDRVFGQEYFCQREIDRVYGKEYLERLFESDQNLLNQFSSITALNNVRDKIINKEELTRIHAAQKTSLEPELQTAGYSLSRPFFRNTVQPYFDQTPIDQTMKIYPDVDKFYLHLLRSKFIRLMKRLLYWKTCNFQCFKMMSESPIYFDREYFANVHLPSHQINLRRLSQISDSETFYVAYFGSRTTYTSDLRGIDPIEYPIELYWQYEKSNRENENHLNLSF